jgi:hypothetical protein
MDMVTARNIIVLTISATVLLVVLFLVYFFARQDTEISLKRVELHILLRQKDQNAHGVDSIIRGKNYQLVFITFLIGLKAYSAQVS